MYLQRGESPCLIKVSEGGDISGHIITNVLRHLDALKLYENYRENGILPVLSIDVQGSRFDLKFLQYICDENHKWTVICGILYGASWWQVGDSAEYNRT